MSDALCSDHLPAKLKYVDGVKWPCLEPHSKVSPGVLRAGSTRCGGREYVGRSLHFALTHHDSHARVLWTWTSMGAQMSQRPVNSSSRMTAAVNANQMPTSSCETA